MRIPYTTDPPPPTTSAEDAQVIERVRARRAPRPLQPLDLALLHAPPVADGWNSFLGAVRTRTTLPASVRELAISRVAVVNGAWYEWAHHAPLAAEAGVSQKALDEVVKGRPGDLAVDSLVTPEEREAVGLGAAEWAVLRVTDEMTRHVRVRDETFAELRKHFNEREVVEVVATVSAYNCVSRFLVALDGKPEILKKPSWAVFAIVDWFAYYRTSKLARKTEQDRMTLITEDPVLVEKRVQT